jgi:glycosyltransferase involved in cell wall biosynthesis
MNPDIPMPRVSIVMPLYNKSTTVLTSLKSVFDQTISDWELIVVDDGSTDGGGGLVVGFSDSRICVHIQANTGVSAARNRGIALARADLVAFLDADDTWEPAFLETVLDLARDFPKAGWFATGYYIKNPHNRISANRLRGLPVHFERGLLPNYFLVAAQSDPPVWTSAVMVRKNLMVGIDGFPEGIQSGEDLLTWARLAICEPLAYDIRPLAIFQTSGIERKPDPQNSVGLALQRLHAEFPQTIGLRNYLGLWNRMQAVMALRFENFTFARKFAWSAWRYDPLRWRNGYVLFLTWMPLALGPRFDAGLRKLLR